MEHGQQPEDDFLDLTANVDQGIDRGGMGGMREATEEEGEQILNNSEIKQQEVSGEEILGTDEGGERVLCHIILDPRVPANRAKIGTLTRDQIKEQIREALEKHCSEIGWWPDGEGPDFVVSQRTDGVWHGWAKLKQSTYHKVKNWSDFPRVQVDGRTQEDIDKGRTTTSL